MDNEEFEAILKGLLWTSVPLLQELTVECTYDAFNLFSDGTVEYGNYYSTTITGQHSRNYTANLMDLKYYDKRTKLAYLVFQAKNPDPSALHPVGIHFSMAQST